MIIAVLQLINGIATIATIISFGIIYPKDKILDLKIYFAGFLFTGTGVVGIVAHRKKRSVQDFGLVYLTLNVVTLTEASFEFAMYIWWHINRRDLYGNYHQYQQIHDALTVEFALEACLTLFATVLTSLQTLSRCKRSQQPDQSISSYKDVATSTAQEAH